MESSNGIADFTSEQRSAPDGIAMKETEQIKRITKYETLMQEAAKLMQREEKSAEEISRLWVLAQGLDAYYTSDEWKQDFADDEAGLLPKDLKRGVLSEDGLYDLLEQIRDNQTEAPIGEPYTMRTGMERSQQMSKVLVITTSLRAKSNSDILAARLIEGAKDAGHEVEVISLKGKTIKYCIGCFACQKTQKCIQKDDAIVIAEKVKNADTLVFVTPIYYYEMSGQMKALLDRMNPLYPSDYRFRKVYMLSVAADDQEATPEKAVNGLQGWIDCFEKAELAGSLFFGGLNDAGEAGGRKEALDEAYAFGKSLV